MPEFVDSALVCCAASLRPPCRSDAAPVCIAQRVNGNKPQGRLVFYNSKLANSLVRVNHSVTQRDRRKIPLVVIALIRLIDNADAVGADNAKVLERAAARRHDGFKALGQLHGHAERYQLVFSGQHGHILGGSEINPVAVMDAHNGIYRPHISDTHNRHHSSRSFKSKPASNSNLWPVRSLSLIVFPPFLVKLHECVKLYCHKNLSIISFVKHSRELSFSSRSRITLCLIHSVLDIQSFHVLCLNVDAGEPDHVRRIACLATILGRSARVVAVFSEFRGKGALEARALVPRCLAHQITLPSCTV
nr:MAG TPA: hypothetical protein [Caudoviricetes sp.]